MWYECSMKIKGWRSTQTYTLKEKEMLMHKVVAPAGTGISLEKEEIHWITNINVCSCTKCLPSLRLQILCCFTCRKSLTEESHLCNLSFYWLRCLDNGKRSNTSKRCSTISMPHLNPKHILCYYLLHSCCVNISPDNKQILTTIRKGKQSHHKMRLKFSLLTGFVMLSILKKYLPFMQQNSCLNTPLSTAM